MRAMSGSGPRGVALVQMDWLGQPLQASLLPAVREEGPGQCSGGKTWSLGWWDGTWVGRRRRLGGMRRYDTGLGRDKFGSCFEQFIDFDRSGNLERRSHEDSREEWDEATSMEIHVPMSVIVSTSKVRDRKIYYPRLLSNISRSQGKAYSTHRQK